MSILALPSAAVDCIAREPQIRHGVTIHNSNALRPVVISDQVDTEIANHLPHPGSVGPGYPLDLLDAPIHPVFHSTSSIRGRGFPAASTKVPLGLTWRPAS